MALAVFALFAALILLTNVRSLIQRRRTGDWGNRQKLMPQRSWGLPDQNVVVETAELPAVRVQAGTEVFPAVEPDAAELRTALAAAGAD